MRKVIRWQGMERPYVDKYQEFKKWGKFSRVEKVGKFFRIGYLAETLSLGADNLSISVPNHLLVLLSRER